MEGELAYDFELDADLSRPDSLKFYSDLRPQHFRILGYGTTDLGKMSEEFEYTAYENEMPVRTFRWARRGIISFLLTVCRS